MSLSHHTVHSTYINVNMAGDYSKMLLTPCYLQNCKNIVLYYNSPIAHYEYLMLTEYRKIMAKWHFQYKCRQFYLSATRHVCLVVCHKFGRSCFWLCDFFTAVSTSTFIFRSFWGQFYLLNVDDDVYLGEVHFCYSNVSPGLFHYKNA